MHNYHTQRAQEKLATISKKWKSSQYREQKALIEADFYIGILSWCAEESKADVRAAIEVCRVFIDSLPWERKNSHGRNNQ